MLHIQCYVDEQNFLLPTDVVKVIVPLTKWHEVPYAPYFIKGMVTIDGHLVPLLDLRQLLKNEDSQLLISTRIILLEILTYQKGKRLVGLIAEGVIDTIKIDNSEFVSEGIKKELAAEDYMDKIAHINSMLYRRINVDKLISKAHQLKLFGGMEDAANTDQS